MNDRERSRYLLEELGQIDDALLDDASRLVLPRLRRKKTVRRLLFAAAAIALTASVLLTVVTLAVMQRVLKGSAAPDPVPEMQPVAESEIRPLLFSGEPYLIAQDEDGRFRAAKLKPSQMNALWDDKGDPVAPGGKVAEKVWVAPGDGRVFSPYLPYTPGNLSYGTLFAYEAEILPGESAEIVLEQYLPR